MSSVLRSLRNQEGFSMAEVVIATLIFVASVVGISGMLISGGANVRMGAVDSTAANLASRRLEEVKSTPFYKPWDASIGNQDIDDYYFNTGQPNGYGGSLDQEARHPQLDNPAVVEDYGTIPNFSKFKRTTAIEYQYVSSLGGNNHFAPAVMCTTSPYAWVPNRPETGETDVPRGGATASVYSELQAMVVEVCVYYKTSSGQKVYKERTLVGQLTTTGATATPFLLIQSINPTTGDYGNNHMTMEIFVKATSPPFGSGAQLDVRLWRTGYTDIAGNSPVASGDGSKITCWFDLSDPNIRVGVPYNISVYWKDGGWQDVFRNCFTVTLEGPTISSIGNFNWAYAKQTARQVTITGDHLLNPSSVILKGPNPDNTYQVNGSVVSSTTTQIVVNFNISSTTTTDNTRWNVMVTTGGGTVTSDSDEKRVWMNPPPLVTAVTETSSPNYYNWAYRAQTGRLVRIEGEYLYGLDQTSDTSATLKHDIYETTKASFGSAPVTNNQWTYNTPVIMNFNPNSAGAGSGTNNTRWKVRVANYGGSSETPADPGKSVLMNPPPTITNLSGAPSPANTGYASGTGALPQLPAGSSYRYSGLSVTGTYLQDNSTVYLVRSSGNPPSTGDTYVAMTNGTTQTDGNGVTGLKLPVNVNNDSADGNSFKQFGGSTDATNANIGGTYYVYFKNNDEQTYFAGSLQATVNHAQYTLSLARSIPDGLGYSADTYGTVSGGGGTYWQDEVSATITATPTANHKFFRWTNSAGATLSTTASTTIRVTSDTATAWFWKKLYWGPDNANANVEGNFVKGYDSASGTEFNALDTADGYNMHVHATDTSNTNREIAGVTNSTLDFTGVNKVRIEWKQEMADAGGYADLIVSTTKNDGKGTYTKRYETTSKFTRQVTDLTATGLGSGYYVRVHARSAGYWSGIWPFQWWTDRPSALRVYRLWLE